MLASGITNVSPTSSIMAAFIAGYGIDFIFYLLDRILYSVRALQPLADEKSSTPNLNPEANLQRDDENSL